MLQVTLGNVAPLEPDGSAAQCGETTTDFLVPHGDRITAVAEIRDAWPTHSSLPPTFVSGDRALCVLLSEVFDCEVRDAD